nr:ORF14 [Bracoviriform inaniti]
MSFYQVHGILLKLEKKSFDKLFTPRQKGLVMAIPIPSGTKCQNEPIVISVTNHCPNKNIQKVQLFVICCIFVIELILLWLKINDDKNKYHETKS